MMQTIIDFALNSLKALARMREGAIGQDGQVTILDLQKAQDIPYMEGFTL